MEEKYIPVVSVAVVALIVIVTFFIAGIAGDRLPAIPGLSPGAGDDRGGERAGGQSENAGDRPGGESATFLPATDATPLSERESAGLLRIREEEQMAYDLYTRWAVRYNHPVFSNIAASEAIHIAEVRLLIERSSLTASRAGNASSGYSSPVIGSLYTSLEARGDASLSAAFEAGLAVEEQDIADLDLVIANTSRADLLQVYGNLRQGSENHRSAFLRQLGR